MQFYEFLSTSEDVSTANSDTTTFSPRQRFLFYKTINRLSIEAFRQLLVSSGDWIEGEEDKKR